MTNYLEEAKKMLEFGSECPGDDTEYSDKKNADIMTTLAYALVAIAERMGGKTKLDTFEVRLDNISMNSMEIGSRLADVEHLGDHITEMEKRMSRIQDVQLLLIERLEKAEARGLDINENLGSGAAIRQEIDKLAIGMDELNEQVNDLEMPGGLVDIVKNGEIVERIRVEKSGRIDLWAELAAEKEAVGRAAKARFEAQEDARSVKHKLNKIFDIVQGDMELDEMKKAILEATY